MGVLRFDSGVNKNAPAFVRWVYLLPVVFALVLASFSMLAALYGAGGQSFALLVYLLPFVLLFEWQGVMLIVYGGAAIASIVGFRGAPRLKYCVALGAPLYIALLLGLTVVLEKGTGASLQMPQNVLLWLLLPSLLVSAIAGVSAFKAAAPSPRMNGTPNEEPVG